MLHKIYSFEIITPCFCAGADPSQAEIRAPSIRGQLRWWFRALGGSASDEAAVFGSVAGDDHSTGSSVRVAISDFKRGPVWNPPTIDQNSPQNYIWHFASVSGKAEKTGPKARPRWTSQGAIPPESTFKVTITTIRSLRDNQAELLSFAIDAFLAFGTIGLRATRGLGAFSCNSSRSWKELIPRMEKAGFIIALRQSPGAFPTWEAALRDWSSWLRYRFRKENKADRYSALGSTVPCRQASAVRFRPILLPTGQFTWVALEAPHDRVLGQKTSNVLTPTSLYGPAPVASSRSR
jgi:CRISPR type III-B/RAMP module RAMP protein Cmr1